MAPTIEAGDVVVTRLVRPSEVEAGDVVTFVDSTRSGHLVTHRVAEVRPEGDAYAFVTRGDANGGEERWSVAAEGTVGSLLLRVPRAGYALVWVTYPGVRAFLVVGGALLLGAALLRRIWARPGPRARARAWAGSADRPGASMWA